MQHAENVNEQFADELDNEFHLLHPQAPYHPLWDDIRREFLRDWQVS